MFFSSFTDSERNSIGRVHCAAAMKSGSHVVGPSPIEGDGAGPWHLGQVGPGY